jgi:hypothetical protein
MRFTLLLFLFSTFTATAQVSYNDFVVKEANKYSGGSYVWSASGCPIDLVHKDQKILAKSPAGTHCSGFTFTVVFNTLKEHQLLEALEVNHLKDFQNHWYGNTVDGAETQCLYALTKYQLGKKVELKDAQAGDFVQFWRNNKTGHSVVFLAWEKDAKGKIIGIKYRSSQKLTNGIGDRVEKVGSEPKDVDIKRVYIARIGK